MGEKSNANASYFRAVLQWSALLIGKSERKPWEKQTMGCTTFQAQLEDMMKALIEAALAELGRLLDETSAAVMPIEVAHLASNSTLKRKLQKEHKAKTVSLIIAVVDSGFG